MQSENATEGTQIDQFTISNLLCARCKDSLLVDGDYKNPTTVQYYYLKLLTKECSEQKEVKFICKVCIEVLQRDAKSYNLLLPEIHQKEGTNIEIRFSADFSESKTNPEQCKIVPEVMHCDKCLANQQTLVEFDQKLKSYVSQSKEKSIIVAERLAEEQNEKDKKLLADLKQELAKPNTSALQKALVLNKLTKLIRKYQKQQ